MWKDKLLDTFNQNKGIIIGGIVGLLLFIFGLTQFITLVFFVFMGMVIGNAIDKNKDGVKESLKNFIDKF